jgi:5-formyltetrahydrofolate cyclo-ligase
MIDPTAIRRECRRKRRALTSAQQIDNSLAFTALARREGLFLRAQRIAAYIGANGELEPTPLFDVIHAYRKRLYLPVLRPHPQLKLWFIHHPKRGTLVRNRFGIPEPPLKHRHICLPWALDVVLVPLVAFDMECNRMGMGGGYYDRTLAFLRQRRVWRRPQLIGVAHECQKVTRLPVREWDVPLDMVITEQRVYRRRQSPAPANRRYAALSVSSQWG